MTFEEYGKLAIRELVSRVFQSDGPLETITYGDLALLIGHVGHDGRPVATSMGAVCGHMGHQLEDISDEWGARVPHLQAMVISKQTQLPSDGLDEFWEDYSRLGKKEKTLRVRTELAKIQEFGSRWQSVLTKLDLEPLPAPQEPSRETVRGRGWGHGESPAHQALKFHVRDNPAIVGIHGQIEAFTEYPLPSLDTLDVLFKCEKEWVAVEVKSSTSDRLPSDYERGLYQCVKYQALLTAMQGDPAYAMPDTVRVVLVLQRQLPAAYKPLADRLNIHLIENVEPI